VPSAESFFFPLDHRLRLGIEGYSPGVLRRAVRQASKAASFQEASDDLQELADLRISPVHLQRLSERIGREWVEVRDEQVQRYREKKLPRSYRSSAAGAAAVMLDGGRVQTRAEDAGRGVSAGQWRETKVACCLTLQTKAQGVDPEPEPPSKFLEPSAAARLVSDIKRRSRPASERGSGDEKPSQDKKPTPWPPRRKRKRCRDRTRVRTVVATMANSETFGWQVAAEVHRRGLDQKKRKACVCDGQAYNWSLYEMHLLPLGFLAILDFVHLLAYLYDAAHVWRGSDRDRGWKTYEQWLRWAWSGKVGSLRSGLRSALAELRSQGHSGRAATLEEALTYVTNNRGRMDYPEYRRLGLPISSAPVESTIKQINRRIKGTEKFWLQQGVEALLQLRAAQLCDDDRWVTNWSRPRKHRRAASTSCFGQAA
jgi:hypothetical protein